MRNQGRDGNFEQVMLCHVDAAYNPARWLVRDASMAEDVVQDAHERACQTFAAFRGGSGREWLPHIVRNTAYSLLKARRRGMEVSLSSATRVAGEDGVDDMGTPDPNPGPEAALAQRQNLAALVDAFSALPFAWRECLILRAVDAPSCKQMARIMDVPIGTVGPVVTTQRNTHSPFPYAETRIGRNLFPAKYIPLGGNIGA